MIGAAHAQTDTTPPAQTPPTTQTPETTPQAPAGTTTPATPPDAAAAPGVAGGPTATRKSATEEIVVTGSRVRRKDLSTPAPVTVISRAQIQNSAVASVGDFLQMLPEQGNATNTQVNNGGNGTTAISLRSIGPQRTLVLVDGKRFVYSGGGADNTVDLNSIPNAAVERVEVLKDGASAVYGSDAIAGVVNIITRRKMNGTEANAYVGSSQRGDGQVYDLSVTTGASGEKGGFVFGAGYFDQHSFLAGNRDWAKFAINYDFTNPNQPEPHGGSSAIPQGRATVNPAKCNTSVCQDLLKAFGAGAKTFIYDPGSAGAIDGFRVYKGSTDAYNYQAVNYLVTPSQRISLFTNGEYRINENARAYVQGSFVNRQSSNLLAPEPLFTQILGIAMSKDNYYNPFGNNYLGNATTGGLDVGNVRKRLVSASGRSSSADIDTFRAVGGIDGTLPEVAGPLQGFFYDVSFNYGRSSGTTITNGSVNGLAVAQAIGPSFKDPVTGAIGCGTAANPIPGCVPANLFGTANPTPDQLPSLGAESLVNHGWNQQAVAQANLSGELFRIASDRPVGLGLGYEFRREYGGFTPDAVALATFKDPNGVIRFVDSDYGSAATKGSFNVNEGYGELDVPLISGLPGVDDLEAQAALRVFNYSTFGTDATYKFGGRYRPIRDVTFRATYSTAFRAPSVPELYAGRAPSAEPASDPCGTVDPNSPLGKQCGAAANNHDDSTQINSNVGGFSGLQPEKATSFTAGVVLEPQIIPRLTLTADYYHINVTNTITGGTLTGVWINNCYPGASGTPDQAACKKIHRNPISQQIDFVDDFNTNLGSLTTDGIDLAGRYSYPTDFGRFGALIDMNILLKFDQFILQNISGASNFDLGVNPRIKFNAGVNYSLAGFSAGILGHYIGGFTECGASDGSSAGGGCYQKNVDPATNLPYARQVKQTMTFDVFAAYILHNPLGNTTLSAGVRNALDTNPPRIYTSFLSYADPSAYDFVGRYFYGRISHAF
jgi:outer membrane receptor protein involved in Fe transport